MTGLTKSAIALGTIGGVGGVSYVVKQQLTREETVLDIGVELIKEGYLPLEDGKSPEWKEILASYKETIGTNPKLKFKDFDGTGVTNELPRLCSAATKVNPSKNKDKDLYEKARLWCTKPRTLEDILSKKGYKLLSFDLSKDEEADAWNKILDAYNASTESNKKFDGVSLLLNENVVKKEKTERDKLRTKCTPLKDKKHHKKDFEKEMKKVELWCSVKLTK